MPCKEPSLLYQLRRTVTFFGQFSPRIPAAVKTSYAGCPSLISFRLDQQDVQLQLEPCILVNPCEFEFLFRRHNVSDT